MRAALGRRQHAHIDEVPIGACIVNAAGELIASALTELSPTATRRLTPRSSRSARRRPLPATTPHRNNAYTTMNPA